MSWIARSEPIGKHAIYGHAAKHEETRYRRQHVITRALYEYTCSITHLCKQRIHYKLPRSSAIDKDYIMDKTNFNILRELNSLIVSFCTLLFAELRFYSKYRDISQEYSHSTTELQIGPK